MTRDSVHHALPTATVGETLAVMGDVFVPNIAKGVIVRRPKAVSMAEKLGLDQRAIRRLQQLNEKYGPGPLMLNTPDSRPMALILDPDHANRVLNETPEPFATAEWAKRKALEHFEPDMALVSHGPNAPSGAVSMKKCCRANAQCTAWARDSPRWWRRRPASCSIMSTGTVASWTGTCSIRPGAEWCAGWYWAIPLATIMGCPTC
ncbi:hypothetical protein [Billgrantia tianxiuensis]|uniref:hypothetical protein n=1 Tax=Billgrantia tianxiuensis TaxID=2497861 RepID=UPI001F3A89A2|nr:hypothetical protein [Halomonas tianxiuensis]